MSDLQVTSNESYLGTREWTAIDRALFELAERKELQETSPHSHIVGYLCRALDASGAVRRPKSREEAMALLKAAQEEFQAATPPGRDILAEFLAERREAAANGD